MLEGSEGSGLIHHTPVTQSLCPHLSVMGWSGRTAQPHIASQHLSDSFSGWRSSPAATRARDLLYALPFCLADIDECEDPAVQCLGGECRNTLGSYECHCQTGFKLINGTVCEGMNPIPAAFWVQDLQPSYGSPFLLSREDASAKANNAIMYGIPIRF